MFNQDNLFAEISHLKKFAWRLTGNKPDSEDLLQSTLLHALEKKHLFIPETDLVKWCSKIMYNKFVTHYRRRIKFETQYDPEPYINKQHVSADQETKVHFTEVGRAFNLLSHEHQDIIYSICVNSMKYKTLAKKLGIPVGTVRSRLSRARTQLQAHLDRPLHFKKAS